MPNQNAYLTKEVGIFPDTVAGLVEGHLGRGDATSALVAAEWFAKNHFAGSGQPWAFAAATLVGQGRREEAREYFQLALESPGELLMRRADRLLDDASFEGEPVAWDSIVPELQALYDEAGLSDFAAGLPATC